MRSRAKLLLSNYVNWKQHFQPRMSPANAVSRIKVRAKAKVHGLNLQVPKSVTRSTVTTAHLAICGHHLRSGRVESEATIHLVPCLLSLLPPLFLSKTACAVNPNRKLTLSGKSGPMRVAELVVIVGVGSLEDTGAIVVAVLRVFLFCPNLEDDFPSPWDVSWSFGST